jgi:hypothetical protein
MLLVLLGLVIWQYSVPKKSVAYFYDKIELPASLHQEHQEWIDTNTGSLWSQYWQYTYKTTGSVNEVKSQLAIALQKAGYSTSPQTVHIKDRLIFATRKAILRHYAVEVSKTSDHQIRIRMDAE